MAIYGRLSFRYRDNIEYTLNNIEVVINNNSKIGLVGDNGAGKTTLIKILSGELTPEGNFRNDYLVAALNQEVDYDHNRGLDQIYKNRGEFLILREGIEDFSGEDLDIFTRYQEIGGWELEASIDKWLNRFNLEYSDLKRDINSLSGGEKTKIRLISVLIEEPDLLILDEPTNHLDINTLTWLEEFLKELTIPYIIVSHDREFLDRTTNSTWEIKNSHLESFSGNYSFYKRTIDERLQRDMHLYTEQTKKINKLNKALTERTQWAVTHQGQTGVEGNAPVYEHIKNYSKDSMRRAKTIEKRINMLIEKEEQKRPEVKQPPRIVFSKNVQRKGKNTLTCETLCKSYDSTLFKNLNLVLKHGERVAVSGRNGSGKTTLLRCILSIEKVNKGRIYIPDNLTVAYFSQDYENLDYSNTILDEITEGDLTNQANVRKSLASVGFKGESVFTQIGILSPGERSKIALIKAMLAETDLLILDEPTNHLEIKTREVVESALLEFKGSILFVSHDRRFTDKIATRSINLEEYV